ncbi:MAG TPA: DUF1684 domain-containing protein [Actinomycetota bacterium]|nr:DUF1684 domain-containing protein [Actinomycetota bacterium]
MAQRTVPASNELQLLDWKRRVFELYAEVRGTGEPKQAWERWKAERDELFATHPQSPIPPEDRGGFTGLPYFSYSPAARVLARVEGATPEHYDIQTSGEVEGSYGFTRFATATFELSGEPISLELYWLDGYGGGLFLPFRDGTSGAETYGAGRYLLDTVKGSDLGTDDGRLVLDFNFAYNPSCAYDPKWVCPLAPLPNRLRVPIRAGARYDAKKPG